MEWSSIISRSLTDEAIAREEALDILRLPDEQIVEVLRAAFEVRQATYGKRVKICVLQNARSGLCPEDCHYCSQSAVSTAPIERYRLRSPQQLVDGARQAARQGARRYCMVTSGRGPSVRDIGQLCEAARRIKAEAPNL